MSDELLPQFRKAPVSEVAFGVQFQSPLLTANHLVKYAERLRDRFPRLQFQPPLPPSFEAFGPGPAPLFSMPLYFSGNMMNSTAPGVQIPPPRIWMLSADESLLIQLQQDRLHLNWRSGQDPSREYPHYEALKSEFDRAFEALVALVVDEGLPPIVANQCELLYVNPIPTRSTGISTTEPQRVFRAWNPDLGKEWGTPIEDLSFSARYQFVNEQNNPFGRLTVAMGSGWARDNSPTFQLELLARGLPIGDGRQGIAEFHDYAHRAIVRCFTAITTPEMHAIWERYQ